MSAFNARSSARLHGVHDDLVRAITRAAEKHEARTGANIEITEGLRTPERQAQLFKAGATRTMNSRHITGHAVDVHFMIAGEARWDWPLYEQFAITVKAAAAEMGIAVQWGGDWASFKDGPHFELSRKVYP